VKRLPDPTTNPPSVPQDPGGGFSFRKFPRRLRPFLLPPPPVLLQSSPTKNSTLHTRRCIFLIGPLNAPHPLFSASVFFIRLWRTVPISYYTLPVPLLPLCCSRNPKKGLALRKVFGPPPGHGFPMCLSTLHSHMRSQEPLGLSPLNFIVLLGRGSKSGIPPDFPLTLIQSLSTKRSQLRLSLSESLWNWRTLTGLLRAIWFDEPPPTPL